MISRGKKCLSNLAIKAAEIRGNLIGMISAIVDPAPFLYISEAAFPREDLDKEFSRNLPDSLRIKVSWIQAYEKLANDYLSSCKVFYEEAIEDAVWRTLIFNVSQLTHQLGTDDISESHGAFIEYPELFLTGNSIPWRAELQPTEEGVKTVIESLHPTTADTGTEVP